MNAAVIALAVAGALGAEPEAAAVPPSKAPWPPEGAAVVDGIVAIVGKDPITLGELHRAAAPFLMRVEAEGGEVDEATRKKVYGEVLEGLVNDFLVLDEAKRMKLETQDRQVDEQVKRLQESNDWDDEELAKALEQHGFASVAAYREHVGKDLLKNQVLSIKVASKVTIDEDEVRRVFREEVGGDGKVEQRRATHVLLKLDEFATPVQEGEAEKLLREIRQAVEGGEASFEEMARKHSQDANAAAGGDLGWFSKGDLVPEFEAAVWALGEGEMSEPVRTEFGLHLIRLTGVRSKALHSKDEEEKLLRQIRFRLRERELERIYSAWMEELRGQAFVEVRRRTAGLE